MAGEVARFALRQPESTPVLIYGSAPPDEVKAVQAKYGREAAGAVLVGATLFSVVLLVASLAGLAYAAVRRAPAAAPPIADAGSTRSTRRRENAHPTSAARTR